jgi:hypothetical protein
MDDSSSLFLLLIVVFVLVYASLDAMIVSWMLMCTRQLLCRLLVHSLNMHGAGHHPRVQNPVGHVRPWRSIFEFVHCACQTGWDERRRGVGDGLQEFQVPIERKRTTEGH